jgi:hypothetical protein
VIRAEAGQIWLPSSQDGLNTWVAEFEEELFGFRGREGGEDGAVDCLSYAVQAIDPLGYGQTEPLPARRPGPFSYY